MRLYPKLNRVIKTTSVNGMDCYKHLGPSLLTKVYMRTVFNPIISPVLGYFNSKRVITDSVLNDIVVEHVDGIDHSDYPDFVDAYIADATWVSSLTALTEDQLDQLNSKHSDFVYNAVQNQLY